MRGDAETQKAGAMSDPDAMVRRLDGLLRGELSAVAAYQQAMERLNGDVRREISECLRSHQERVEMLRQQIVRLGGEPSERADPWNGVSTRDIRGMFAALAEGEARGLRLYREGLVRFASSPRALVQESLLPGQERTSRAVRALENRRWGRGH